MYESRHPETKLALCVGHSGNDQLRGEVMTTLLHYQTRVVESLSCDIFLQKALAKRESSIYI